MRKMSESKYVEDEQEHVAWEEGALGVVANAQCLRAAHQLVSLFLHGNRSHCKSLRRDGTAWEFKLNADTGEPLINATGSAAIRMIVKLCKSMHESYVYVKYAYHAHTDVWERLLADQRSGKAYILQKAKLDYDVWKATGVEQLFLTMVKKEDADKAAEATAKDVKEAATRFSFRTTGFSPSSISPSISPSISRSSRLEDDGMFDSFNRHCDPQPVPLPEAQPTCDDSDDGFM